MKNISSFPDKIRTLFVDDDVDVLKQAKSILEEHDDRLDVETTTSTEEALELFERNEYEAVVSDYKIPDMDGIEFLRILREEKNSDVPFIIFTGRGKEEVALRALNLGASHYFTKSADLKSQYASLAQKIVDSVVNRRTREALRKEREMKETYLDVSDCVILDINSDGEVVQINESGSELVGEEKEKIIGKNWFDNYVPERFREKVRKTFRKILEGDVEKGKSCEAPILTSDGEERQMLWRNTALRDDEGNIAGTVSSCIDITEREEAKVRFQTLFEAIEDGVLVLDKNGKVVEANDALVEMAGFDSKEEIIGEDPIQFVSPEEREIARKDTKMAYRKGESGGRREFKVVTEDEREIYTQSSAGMVYDENDDLKQIINVVRDITEQKELERELKQYERAVEFSEDLIIGIDKDYSYLFANKTFLQYHNLEEEEVVGHKIPDVVGEKVFEENIKPNVDRCLTGKSVQYEMSYEFEELGERYFSIYYYPLRNEEGEIYGAVGSLRDITNQRQAELEDRKRQLVTAAAEAMVENIAPRFGVRISAPELGLEKELDYIADLATQPTKPRAVFDFLVKGIERTLKDKGVDLKDGEVRGAVLPVFRDFLKNVLKLSDKYEIKIPEEYKDFEKQLIPGRE